MVSRPIAGPCRIEQYNKSVPICLIVVSSLIPNHAINIIDKKTIIANIKSKF